MLTQDTVPINEFTLNFKKLCRARFSFCSITLDIVFLGGISADFLSGGRLLTRHSSALTWRGR